MCVKVFVYAALTQLTPPVFEALTGTQAFICSSETLHSYSSLLMKEDQYDGFSASYVHLSKFFIVVVNFAFIVPVSPESLLHQALFVCLISRAAPC